MGLSVCYNIQQKITQVKCFFTEKAVKSGVFFKKRLDTYVVLYVYLDMKVRLYIMIL